MEQFANAKIIGATNDKALESKLENFVAENNPDLVDVKFTGVSPTKALILYN